MLIVLRGNSGSGKSSTAKLLRKTVIERGSNRKIALVEQDYLRRIILNEKESLGTDNIELIYSSVSFCLKRDYAVTLEGILYSKRYKEMLSKLCELHAENYFYYFDVSLEESLKRHALKANAEEFGEKEMKQWYKPHDVLGFKNEIIIPEHMSQRETVDKILNTTRL